LVRIDWQPHRFVALLWHERAIAKAILVMQRHGGRAKNGKAGLGSHGVSERIPADHAVRRV
jgi:hypothetical protein